MSEKLEEDKILVMFPSAKNYPLQEDMDDPVALASEQVDQLAAEIIPNEPTIPRHIDLQLGNRPSVRMSLDELVDVVDAQIELLKENSKRMKYYLDEIEFFWPDSND